MVEKSRNTREDTGISCYESAALNYRCIIRKETIVCFRVFGDPAIGKPITRITDPERVVAKARGDFYGRNSFKIRSEDRKRKAG